MTSAAPVSSARPATDVQVIDADVHAIVPSIETLLPYMSDHWREYTIQTGFEGPSATAYPPGAPTSHLPGTAAPESVERQREILCRQVFEQGGASLAILNCEYAVDSIHNPDAAEAVTRAVNDWLIDQWLEAEPRLRGSIVVPAQLPDVAAREIDRVGPHPQIVQAFLPARTRVPYGNRFYHPLFAAAVRNDLVVGIQFGGAPGTPPTGTGWPSFYVEEYAGMAVAFQSQLLSILAEGVFARFPALRLALVESGFSWLPPFLWRLDKEWKGLRREIPWVVREPSAYVRDHVRLTLEPFDAPVRPESLSRIVDQLGTEQCLMFSSDYPHWHRDDPHAVPLPTLPESLATRLMSTNALEFYRV
jgi:uncharacterized protein